MIIVLAVVVDSRSVEGVGGWEERGGMGGGGGGGGGGRVIQTTPNLYTCDLCTNVQLCGLDGNNTTQRLS